MRSLLVFLILAIAIITVGFLPRPLIKPDWRHTYEAAKKSQDCEEIDRTIDMLFVVGLEAEGYAEAYNNYRVGRCKYADLSKKEIEDLKFLWSAYEEWDGRTFLNSGIRTSRFGQAYQILNREKYPASEFVRANEKLLFKTYLVSCIDKIPQGMGGFPNYALLQYALNNPAMSVDKIAAIAREQRAVCAKKIVADAQVIASAASTPNEFASFIPLVWIASVLAKESPELGPELEKLENQIPEEAYTIGGYIREEAVYTTYTCKLWYADRVLEGAVKCALHASLASGVEKNAEINAIYYARRAKRLGWRDISQIEENAASQISAECREAIIQLEEIEAQNITDPRDYQQLAWPLGAGEACGPVSD